MKLGEVYQCKKNNAIMGCDYGTPNPIQLIKIANGKFDNQNA